MMAWDSSNGRGTFPLDRVIAGVGRIQRSSGTRAPAEYRAINAMISEFRERMRTNALYRDALVALHTGAVTPLEMLGAYREDRLPALLAPPAPPAPPEPVELSPAERRAREKLKATWATWLTGEMPHRTRQARESIWRRLEEVLPDVAKALPEEAECRHLPDAVLELRRRMSGRPAYFNRSLAAAMAFSRAMQSRTHPIYVELQGIEPLKERPEERSAPSLVQAIELRDNLATRSAAAAAIWWSMVITGMGPAEYDGRWREWDGEAEGVFVDGTKRSARKRVVPHLGPVVRRAMGWKQFRAELKLIPEKLWVAGVRPQAYDARRVFERMLEETAKLLPVHRKLLFGHALSTTEKYGRPVWDDVLRTTKGPLAEFLEQAEATVRERRKQAMRSA